MAHLRWVSGHSFGERQEIEHITDLEQPSGFLKGNHTVRLSERREKMRSVL